MKTQLEFQMKSASKTIQMYIYREISSTGIKFKFEKKMYMKTFIN